MTEKNVKKIGWVASVMAMMMYFSYIDQIMLNLAGETGSVVLPAVTIINCITWTMYGWLGEQKDWPIIVCNIPGITLGIATLVTAMM